MKTGANTPVINGEPWKDAEMRFSVRGDAVLHLSVATEEMQMPDVAVSSGEPGVGDAGSRKIHSLNHGGASKIIYFNSGTFGIERSEAWPEA